MEKPIVPMDTTTLLMDLIQMLTAGSVPKATSVPTMPQLQLRRSRFVLRAITVLQVQRHPQFAQLASFALRVQMFRFPAQQVTTELVLVSTLLSVRVVAQRAITAIK